MIFSHPQTGECLKSNESIIVTTSTAKTFTATNATTADPFIKKAEATSTEATLSTEHNPYEHYSGEYGKEYNHYVKMGINDSNVQQSIDKIVNIEIEKVNHELHRQAVEDSNEFIIFDVPRNELNDFEPLKHPQYVSDHHAANHQESIAMVTVGCLILGMLVFLLAMVYIRRVTRRLPASRDIDPEADLKRFQKLEPSKILHQPLPSNLKFSFLTSN